MPMAPAATLLERVPSWLDATLRAHGVPDPFIAGELAEATQVGLARTNNRSVLGVMNEFVRLADWQKSTIGTESDRIDLALELSEVPTSPLYKRNISPRHELAAVVAEMR